MPSPVCGLLQPLAPELSSIRRNARCAQRTLINCHVRNARVFEEVRRWEEGRVYWSIEEKVEAVNASHSRLESDPARVGSPVS